VVAGAVVDRRVRAAGAVVEQPPDCQPVAGPERALETSGRDDHRREVSAVDLEEHRVAVDDAADRDLSVEVPTGCRS
jgi:hypothetical protein